MAYPFIHIRSQMFPVQPGEEEATINPNLWGKALCEYLAKKLRAAGYEADYMVEDWGWLVDVSRDGFSNIVGVYSDASQGAHPTDYVVTLLREGKRRFSLRKFKSIDDTAWCDTLAADLRNYLTAEGIEIVAVTDEMPF